MSDARKIYIQAAVVIPAWFSFLAGLYTGAAVGSFCWMMGWSNPLRAGALAASLAAMAAFLRSLQWWVKRVRDTEADLYALAAGQMIQEPPLTIRYERPTDGGMTAQIVKAPWTRSQHELVARMWKGAGRVNVDSLGEIFGKKAASYRDWLVEQRYAMWRNEEAPRLGIVVTDKGKEFFEEVMASPYPSGGEMMRLESVSRMGQTRDTRK